MLMTKMTKTTKMVRMMKTMRMVMRMKKTKMVRILKTMRMVTKMMTKKGDSYLCFAAWAEGEPRYRGVPFLAHPLSLSQMSSFLSSKLSSQNRKIIIIRIVLTSASWSGQFS